MSAWKPKWSRARASSLLSKVTSIVLSVTLIIARQKVRRTLLSLVLTNILENKLSKVSLYLWSIATLTLIKLLRNTVVSTKVSYVRIVLLIIILITLKTVKLSVMKTYLNSLKSIKPFLWLWTQESLSYEINSFVDHVKQFTSSQFLKFISILKKFDFFNAHLQLEEEQK